MRFGTRQKMELPDHIPCFVATSVCIPPWITHRSVVLRVSEHNMDARPGGGMKNRRSQLIEDSRVGKWEACDEETCDRHNRERLRH